MKWGSTKPSTIRRSASTYSRFRKTVSPSRDFPAGSIVAGSWAVWLTTPVAAQDLGADHRPQLLGRVHPVRARAVHDREPLGGDVGELLEEPRQQPVGRQRAGEVGDHDRHPVGRPSRPPGGDGPRSAARTASRKAAASSGSPGTKRGSTTVTFVPGISTSSPSRPYCRCTRIPPKLRPGAGRVKGRLVIRILLKPIQDLDTARDATDLPNRQCARRPDMNKMTRRMAIVAIAAVPLVLAACNDDDENLTGPSTGTAMVRVAHLSPDAPPVDVYVNGSRALSAASPSRTSRTTCRSPPAASTSRSPPPTRPPRS